ncbi:MAG: nicotinate-nucleotide adenylyltransferase [Iphinoe sp. HA4291-MV1]|jgi:nicotinate-nucleotide adenylyltransferase|nr:nicotinate-nucleotide adenylyltransferase [Iphinoe sp. HA4291-MV1]
MKVALFGMSADPPTAGHQTVIRWLSEHFDWVAVWAVNNPFKSHQTRLEHRVAMLHLLIADIDSSKHNIGLEQELSHLRTLETLEKAKKLWLEAEFTLVVGSDLLAQLPRWYRIEDLLQQVQLLVIPRPRYPIDESNLQVVQKLGGKVTVANFIGPDVSSTAYRENGDREALTPLVVDYIQREHLYKCLPGNVKS